MPCVGPTEEECRYSERAYNQKKIGKSWTDTEWAENTACAYTAYARHKTPLPQWAILWSDEHEAKDKARKQAEKNWAEQERESKLRQFEKLKKELGMK